MRMRKKIRKKGFEEVTERKSPKMGSHDLNENNRKEFFRIEK